MIRLENLSKSFWTPKGPKVVADNINVTFPSGKAVGHVPQAIRSTRLAKT